MPSTICRIGTSRALCSPSSQALHLTVHSFTLFAPTNWALTKKPHGIPEDLADVTSLATLYRYFVKYPTDESDQAPRRKIVKHILHGVLQ